MRVLRVFHAGRMSAHRARDRGLTAAGVEVSLVVPTSWPEPAAEREVQESQVTIHELPVTRPGDVNRHAYRSADALRDVIRQVAPDILDVLQEPFSVVSRQWLAAAPPDLPVVMYTAQNVDKRFPPPFARYETAAYRRVAALYPCSAQAAAVARGKGFGGLIEVLPLGYDEALFTPGGQSPSDDELVLGLFGRLEPYKGVTDAVEILARVNRQRPARLVVVGSGPEATTANRLAEERSVADRLELIPWQGTEALAATYRACHVVLVPSRPTSTWVEQFGRVIVEGQASGAVVAGYASGSIPEVAGDASLLVEVDRHAALADRILDLFDDENEWMRRRERGLELSRTRTWTAIAARQAELYRRVLAGNVPRLDLPRSPGKRRALAVAEFGETAATRAGSRPFALPLLRRGGLGPRLLGEAIDAAAELRAGAFSTAGR